MICLWHRYKTALKAGVSAAEQNSEKRQINADFGADEVYFFHHHHHHHHHLFATSELNIQNNLKR